MAVKKEVARSGLREILGIVLLALFALSMFSLFSYDAGDISILKSPPNDPPRNFIGPAGAWFGFLAFMGLGACGYFLPVVFLLLGLMCLFKREGRVWPKALWALGLMVAVAALMELNADAWSGSRARLNVGSAGGVVGDIVTSGMFVPLLGTVGTAILMVALALVSAVLVIDVHPGVAIRHAWGLVHAGLARVEAARKARQDRLQQLEEEQRDLARRRRRLEDAVKSNDIGVVTRKPAKADAAAEEAPAVPPAPRVRARMPDPVEPPKPVVKIRPRAEVAVPSAPDPGAPTDSPGIRDRIVGMFGPKESAASPPAAAEVPDVAPGVPDNPVEPAPDAVPAAPSPKARRTVAPDAAPEPPVNLAVLPASGEAWKLPDLSLLDAVPERREAAATGADFAIGAQVLKETLNEFGIDVEVTNVERGPVITRYELLPAPGVRVETIAKLNNNIALAMKAETVRVQAPIPGKGVVGIEVPNPKTTTVYLREVIESPEWRSGKAALPLCLGKDVGGRDQVADLAEMPHLLIAGATGSGKTVCMNSILAGLLLARSPAQMRLMLIDPKIVEFAGYNGLPHLVVPVITDPKKVSLGLRWAINEMEKRYKLFAKVGVRNIKAFNSRPVIKQEELFGEGEMPPPEDPADAVPDRVPYIVIVVDELADLMLVAQADIENQIARLAQLSRAVGIHMILATQRPSVNVITGTIKANFPARISFQVAQKVDSRTILDAAGADKLLGKGDMLFLPPGSPKLIRAQGTLTTDAELQRVVQHWKQQGVPSYETSIKDKIEGKQVDLPEMEEDDELLQQSMEIIRQTRRASTSSLQRRLRIGYTRAARIMDLLEQKGIVGPAQGADPREILIDLDGDVPAPEPREQV